MTARAVCGLPLLSAAAAPLSQPSASIFNNHIVRSKVADALHRTPGFREEQLPFRF